VQIGDVEPIGTAQPADWVQEIAQWTQVYRKVVGQGLSFFHADISWNGPWQQQLSMVKSRVQAGGIKFGIIYDGGGGKNESDDLWTREAEQRFRMVESSPSMVPDHAVMQSWARWPHRMLPETGPATMTNLVLNTSRLTRRSRIDRFELHVYQRRPISLLRPLGCGPRPLPARPDSAKNKAELVNEGTESVNEPAALATRPIASLASPL
jgi:hypothetical protein